MKKKQLKSLREDPNFNEIYSKAEKFAEELNIEVSPSIDSSAPQKRRVRETSKKLQDYFIMTSTGNRSQISSTSVDNKSYFKINIFLPSIDNVLSEFKQRFSDNSVIFGTIQTFDPNSDEFLKYELVEKFRTSFSSKISEDVAMNLEVEVETAKVLLADLRNLKNVFDVYDVLVKTSASFECLLRLIEIVVTIPVSTASNERLFSTL